MHKLLKSTLFFILLALGMSACSKKPAPAPSQTSAANLTVGAPPAAAAAPAQAPAAASFDGSWSGDSGKDLPVSFSVKNNQLSSIYASYRVHKEGGCTAFASFTSDDTATIKGKTFTATGKKDQMNDHIEFTMNGTFTSDKEASGTLHWTGKSGLCGDIDTQANWSVKKEAQSSDDD
jgi:hypothetical protein